MDFGNKPKNSFKYYEYHIGQNPHGISVIADFLIKNINLLF